MKIKITTRSGNEVILKAVTHQTNITPNGNAYYSIGYMLDGESVYNIKSGCCTIQPSPIDALTWNHETRKVVAEGTPSAKKCINSISGVFWTVEINKPHREYLLDALELVVLD